MSGGEKSKRHRARAAERKKEEEEKKNPPFLFVFFLSSTSHGKRKLPRFPSFLKMSGTASAKNLPSLSLFR